MRGQNPGKGPKMSRGAPAGGAGGVGVISSQQSVESEVPNGLIQSWHIQHLLSPYRPGNGDTKMEYFPASPSLVE